MARYHQTWRCTACGHVGAKTVTYSKNREPDTPLAIVARRARCTKCGARGRCEITETKARV